MSVNVLYKVDENGKRVPTPLLTPECDTQEKKLPRLAPKYLTFDGSRRTHLGRAFEISEIEHDYTRRDRLKIMANYLMDVATNPLYRRDLSECAKDYWFPFTSAYVANPKPDYSNYFARFDTSDSD